MKSLKNKKIIKDMIINTIASIIPVLFLQVLILPKISIIVGDSSYGLLVTYLSIFNIIPATFGNVLNNIRLLNNDASSKNGDYNYLLCIFEFISTLLLIIIALLYGQEFSVLNLLLVVILGVLWLFREYHIVIFRIELNYLNVLKDNVILTIGYLIGFLVFIVFPKWQLIYIVGYLFSISFILNKTNLHKEKLIKTKKFNKISKDCLQLMFSNIISRSITYADKLIIYPILGGSVVSVYYAASIFSKITNLALSPITSVILGYVSKLKSNKSSLFNMTLLLSSFILIIGSFFCYLISKPVLNFIYPQYVNEAVKYVPIVLISMIFATQAHILNPFILKFYKMKWQIIINGVSLIFYLVISIFLLKKFKLYGFCFGVLFTNLLKLILILCLYYYKKGGTIENEKI